MWLSPHTELVTGTRTNDPQAHIRFTIYPTAPSLSSPESLLTIMDLKLPYSTRGATVGQQANITAVIFSLLVVNFTHDSKIE